MNKLILPLNLGLVVNVCLFEFDDSYRDNTISYREAVYKTVDINFFNELIPYKLYSFKDHLTVDRYFYKDAKGNFFYINSEHRDFVPSTKTYGAFMRYYTKNKDMRIEDVIASYIL